MILLCPGQFMAGDTIGHVLGTLAVGLPKEGAVRQDHGVAPIQAGGIEPRGHFLHEKKRPRVDLPVLGYREAVLGENRPLGQGAGLFEPTIGGRDAIAMLGRTVGRAVEAAPIAKIAGNLVTGTGIAEAHFSKNRLVGRLGAGGFEIGGVLQGNVAGRHAGLLYIVGLLAPGPVGPRRGTIKRQAAGKRRDRQKAPSRPQAFP